MSERPLYRQPPNALRERYKFKSGYGCSASRYGPQSMARAPEFSVPIPVATPRCLPVDSVGTDDRSTSPSSHETMLSATASVPTANGTAPSYLGASGSVVSERAAAVQAAAECPARALQIQVRIWVLGEQVWAAVHG